MIEISHIITPSPEEMEFIVEGMRNAKNSWNLSDSEWKINNLGQKDNKLMNDLCVAGAAHRKYMRMMNIYMRVNAPLYWWKECDTYKFLVRNSCSTMHKIQAKEFTLDDFSHEHLFTRTKRKLIDDIKELNYWRDVFLTGGGQDLLPEMLFYDFDDIDGFIANSQIIDLDLPVKCKDAWWQMIQLLPSSYNQTANIMFNYETANAMYHWRNPHKLDEWNKKYPGSMCNVLESLPYSNLITNN